MQQPRQFRKIVVKGASAPCSNMAGRTACNWGYALSVALTVVFYYADVVSDCVLLVELVAEARGGSGTATVFASLVGGVMFLHPLLLSLLDLSMAGGMGWRGVALNFTFTRMLWTAASPAFVLPSGQRASRKDAARVCSDLKLFETLLESIPQLYIQAVLLLWHTDTGAGGTDAVVVAVSLAFSLLSIATVQTQKTLALLGRAGWLSCRAGGTLLFYLADSVLRATVVALAVEVYAELSVALVAAWFSVDLLAELYLSRNDTTSGRMGEKKKAVDGGTATSAMDDTIALTQSWGTITTRWEQLMVGCCACPTLADTYADEYEAAKESCAATTFCPNPSDVHQRMQYTVVDVDEEGNDDGDEYTEEAHCCCDCPKQCGHGGRARFWDNFWREARDVDACCGCDYAWPFKWLLRLSAAPSVVGRCYAKQLATSALSVCSSFPLSQRVRDRARPFATSMAFAAFVVAAVVGSRALGPAHPAVVCAYVAAAVKVATFLGAVCGIQSDEQVNTHADGFAIFALNTEQGEGLMGAWTSKDWADFLADPANAAWDGYGACDCPPAHHV